MRNHFSPRQEEKDFCCEKGIVKYWKQINLNKKYSNFKQNTCKKVGTMSVNSVDFEKKYVYSYMLKDREKD
jgi:hypothetical protein